MITGCCKVMKMMCVAESGAERSVMDEESDLEQIKGCQKLLYHRSCFWLWRCDAFMERVYYPALKSFPDCELQTVFSKMAAVQCKTLSLVNPQLIDPSVDVRVTCQEWKIQCQQKLSIYFVSVVHYLLCTRSAEVRLWFIVKGGSVLHVVITTEFTRRGPMHQTLCVESQQKHKDRRILSVRFIKLCVHMILFQESQSLWN